MDDLIRIRVDADVGFFHDGIDIPSDCLEVAERFVIRNESLCHVPVRIGGSRFQVEAACDWECGRLKGISLHWVEDCDLAEALRKLFEATYQRICDAPPDIASTEQVDVYFDPRQKVISIGSVPKMRDWLSQLVIPHRNVVEVVSFALGKLQCEGDSRIARAISLATERDYCSERLVLDSPLLDRCGIGRIKPELLTEYEDVLDNPWGYVLLADTSNLDAKAFVAWAKDVGFPSRRLSAMMLIARQNCLGENTELVSSHATDNSLGVQSADNDRGKTDGRLRIQSVDDDIRQNYASGFDFKATSWRLIEKRTGCHFSRSALCEYKKRMFKRPDGLHFFPDMILDEKSRSRMLARANELLSTAGMFSLETLMNEFADEFRNISDVSDFKAYFGQFVAETIGVTVRGHAGWYMCFPAAVCEEEGWKIVVSRVREALVNAGDAVSIADLVDQLPYLSLEIVLRMGVMHIPDAISFGADGMCFLKLLGSYYLPDDFGTVISNFVRTTEANQTITSVLLLEGMLNERYGDGFRINYGLEDDSVFKQVVSKSVKLLGIDGYDWRHDAFANQARHSNVFGLFRQNRSGVFHEEDFYSFAKEKRSVTNRCNLLGTYLRRFCVRLSKDWWMPVDEFVVEFNVDETVLSSIGDLLNAAVLGKAFCPIALLPSSFYDELPRLVAGDREQTWNPYLLASVAVLKVGNAAVVNEEVGSYTVTAIIIPTSAKRPVDVVDYVLSSKPKGYFANEDDAFDFLKGNNVRLAKTDNLMRKIAAILGR